MRKMRKKREFRANRREGGKGKARGRAGVGEADRDWKEEKRVFEH